MYQSPVAFEAPLPPRMFFADDAVALEQQRVFETTWQMVGLASSIGEPGQYLSTDIGRVPVVVRNFDGQLIALKNVCAHRHCSLVVSAHGKSEKLKCPYHGWEYGADGRTRRIPAARNFPDFDRERYKLPAFPLEQCGDLLFVRLVEKGPSLREWLGELYGRFEKWTSLPYGKHAVTRTMSLPVNWKIPIEGSLESYHIPEVHPQTFGEDPGESKSEHSLAKYTTSFFTAFNTPRLIDKLLKVYERFILTILGATFDPSYEHHHVFPNLLISHTSSLTLVQTVRPVTGDACITEVRQYSRQSLRNNPISRGTAFLWGRFLSALTLKILKEDISIFPHVQRGERAATERSILGRCEERLFAFEKFIDDQIREGSESSAATTAGTRSELCESARSCTDATCNTEVR